MTLSASLSAQAQVFNYNAAIASPVYIPDNSAVGIVQSVEVTGLSQLIGSLQVQIELQSHSGDTMYNGDLYLTLVHNGTSGVLLNRVGRRDGFSAGYGDAGLKVTLRDSAAADIHSYRVALNGNDLIPLAAGDTPGVLTGTWQPDGRTADPEAVLTTSPRTGSLSQFVGTNPNGTWSLFVSDLSPGATADLISWNLTITQVPEPRAVAALSGLSLLAFGLWRRFRR